MQKSNRDKSSDGVQRSGGPPEEESSVSDGDEEMPYLLKKFERRVLTRRNQVEALTEFMEMLNEAVENVGYERDDDIVFNALMIRLDEIRARNIDSGRIPDDILENIKKDIKTYIGMMGFMYEYIKFPPALKKDSICENDGKDSAIGTGHSQTRRKSALSSNDDKNLVEVFSPQSTGTDVGAGAGAVRANATMNTTTSSRSPKTKKTPGQQWLNSILPSSTGAGADGGNATMNTTTSSRSPKSTTSKKTPANEWLDSLIPVNYRPGSGYEKTEKKVDDNTDPYAPFKEKTEQDEMMESFGYFDQPTRSSKSSSPKQPSPKRIAKTQLDEMMESFNYFDSSSKSSKSPPKQPSPKQPSPKRIAKTQLDEMMESFNYFDSSSKSSKSSPKRPLQPSPQPIYSQIKKVPPPIPPRRNEIMVLDPLTNKMIPRLLPVPPQQPSPSPKARRKSTPQRRTSLQDRISPTDMILDPLTNKPIPLILPKKTTSPSKKPLTSSPTILDVLTNKPIPFILNRSLPLPSSPKKLNPLTNLSIPSTERRALQSPLRPQSTIIDPLTNTNIPLIIPKSPDRRTPNTLQLRKSPQSSRFESPKAKFDKSFLTDYDRPNRSFTGGPLKAATPQDSMPSSPSSGSSTGSQRHLRLTTPSRDTKTRERKKPILPVTTRNVATSPIKYKPPVKEPVVRATSGKGDLDKSWDREFERVEFAGYETIDDDVYSSGWSPMTKYTSPLNYCSTSDLTSDESYHDADENSGGPISHRNNPWATIGGASQRNWVAAFDDKPFSPQKVTKSPTIKSGKSSSKPGGFDDDFNGVDGFDDAFNGVDNQKVTKSPTTKSGKSSSKSKHSSSNYDDRMTSASSKQSSKSPTYKKLKYSSSSPGGFDDDFNGVGDQFENDVFSSPLSNKSSSAKIAAEWTATFDDVERRNEEREKREKKRRSASKSPDQGWAAFGTPQRPKTPSKSPKSPDQGWAAFGTPQRPKTPSKSSKSPDQGWAAFGTPQRPKTPSKSPSKSPEQGWAAFGTPQRPKTPSKSPSKSPDQGWAAFDTQQRPKTPSKSPKSPKPQQPMSINDDFEATFDDRQSVSRKRPKSTLIKPPPIPPTNQLTDKSWVDKLRRPRPKQRQINAEEMKRLQEEEEEFIKAVEDDYKFGDPMFKDVSEFDFDAREKIFKKKWEESSRKFFSGPAHNPKPTTTTSTPTTATTSGATTPAAPTMSYKHATISAITANQLNQAIAAVAAKPGIGSSNKKPPGKCAKNFNCQGSTHSVICNSKQNRKTAFGDVKYADDSSAPQLGSRSSPALVGEFFYYKDDNDSNPDISEDRSSTISNKKPRGKCAKNYNCQGSTHSINCNLKQGRKTAFGDVKYADDSSAPQLGSRSSSALDCEFNNGEEDDNSNLDISEDRSSKDKDEKDKTKKKTFSKDTLTKFFKKFGKKK